MSKELEDSYTLRRSDTVKGRASSLRNAGLFMMILLFPVFRYATSIFDYQFEDFEVIDYNPHSAITAEISAGYL
jgi:hypothetical protein